MGKPHDPLIPIAKKTIFHSDMPAIQNNDEAFVHIKPSLKQVIEVMELFHCDEEIRASYRRLIGPWPEDDDQRVREDLADLEYSPQKALLTDQARIIWNQVVQRQITAIWFIRTHRPVTVLLSVLCERAEVPITHVLNGELTDEDFENLTSEVGNLAGSPLNLCDASHPDSFQKALLTLNFSGLTGLVICDWVLAGEELALAQRLTRDLEISVICPH